MTLPRQRVNQSPGSNAQVLVGVGVMLGWFVVAAIGAVLWVAAHSDTETVGAYQLLSSRAAAVVVVFFVGLPIGVVGMIAGAVLLTRLVRRNRSGLLTGTLAGVGGLFTGAVVVIGGLLLWSVVARVAGW